MSPFDGLPKPKTQNIRYTIDSHEEVKHSQQHENHTSERRNVIRNNSVCVCACLYNKLKWPHCTTQHLLTLAASIRFGSFLRYRMLLLLLIVCFSVGALVCISFTLYTAVQKPYTSSRLHANTLRYRHRSVHCTLILTQTRARASTGTQAQCESV